MWRFTIHRSPVSQLARSVFGLSLCLFGAGVGYGQEAAPAIEVASPVAPVEAAPAVESATAAGSVDLAVADEAQPAEEVKPAAPPKTDGDKPAEAKQDGEKAPKQPPRPSFGGRSGRGPGMFGGPPFGRGGFGGMNRSGPSSRNFAGPQPEGQRVGNRIGNEEHRVSSGPRGSSRRFADRGRGGRKADRFARSSRGDSRHGRGQFAHSSRSHRSHDFGRDFGRGHKGGGGRRGDHSMSRDHGPDRPQGGRSFGLPRRSEHRFGPMASRDRGFGPGRDHSPRPGMDCRLDDHHRPMPSWGDHRSGADRPHGPPHGGLDRRPGGPRFEGGPRPAGGPRGEERGPDHRPGEGPRGDGPRDGEDRGR